MVDDFYYLYVMPKDNKKDKKGRSYRERNKKLKITGSLEDTLKASIPKDKKKKK